METVMDSPQLDSRSRQQLLTLLDGHSSFLCAVEKGYCWLLRLGRFGVFPAAPSKDLTGGFHALLTSEMAGTLPIFTSCFYWLAGLEFNDCPVTRGFG